MPAGEHERIEEERYHHGRFPAIVPVWAASVRSRQDTRDSYSIRLLNASRAGTSSRLRRLRG